MNWDEAIEFSFDGEFKEAKVLEVYDDMIQFPLIIGSSIMDMHLRVMTATLKKNMV